MPLPFGLGVLNGLLARGVFPRWLPKPALRPTTRSASGAAVRITWWGTAAHVFSTGTTTVLLDPFLSRPGLLDVGLLPLRPNEAALRPHLPHKVDAILLGHSHYDHLMDAPTLARWTGAKLVGSRSTVSFARAEGVAESQLVEIPAEGGHVTVGDIEVRFVPSRHGRIFAGRVPFPGEVPTPPRVPARVSAYKMGGAFGIVMRAPGATVYHNGSADLVDAELAGESADVLLVGLAGRQATPGYLRRLAGLLRPKLIVPTHHDAFFAPLADGLRLLPGIDLDGFEQEARDVAHEARLITPAHLEVLAVPPHDARASALVA